MRVRVRRFELDSAPPLLSKYLGSRLEELGIEVGEEYEVCAVAVFDGIVILQIVRIGIPGWIPAWVFDFLDSKVPDDWITSVFRDEPSFVLGPEFIAKSVGAYEAMVGLEPEAVDAFWERVDSRSDEET